MLLNNKIEFQAERDFGSRLNVAFDFIKRNFAPLLGSILVVTVPLLALGGALVLFFSRYLQLETDSLVSNVLLGFAFFAFYIIIVFLPGAAVYSYIKLYQERPEAVFSVGQVLNELKKHWFSLLLTLLLSYLLIIMASLLLILPGIYVAVPLVLVPYIVVIEETNVITAISRAFYLVKNYWWETLGMIIIANIISWLFMFAFQVPFVVVVGILPFVMLDTMDWSIWGILTGLVYLIGTFIVQIIPLVIYAVHYHHLLEIKESIGLMKRISSLGQQVSQAVDEEETY
ncbi:MAG: hypothetical protein RMJ87_11750 [Cytophagales bacterium]|nr:hypothetical protein [Bernardetiaceae bacterium]MDW8205694.1 hypothetical protein [Cytophagales bacterium]